MQHPAYPERDANAQQPAPLSLRIQPQLPARPKPRRLEPDAKDLVPPPAPPAGEPGLVEVREIPAEVGVQPGFGAQAEGARAEDADEEEGGEREDQAEGEARGQEGKEEAEPFGEGGRAGQEEW